MTVTRRAKVKIATLLLLTIGWLTSCAVSRPQEVLLDKLVAEDWEVQGAPVWQFLDGELSVAAGGADSLLVSRSAFSQYRLSVEFWVDSQTNSGVLIHCQDRNDVSPLSCYEINIWDDHPNQTFRTGAIVTHVAPELIINTAGRWNRFDILAGPERVTVELNGRLISELADTEFSSGPVVLQRANAGAVRFRNIAIQPIP